MSFNKRPSTSRKDSTLFLPTFAKISKIIPAFTSKEFLTKYSLFNNLHSSENFRLEPMIHQEEEIQMTEQQRKQRKLIEIQEKEFISTIFQKQSATENQLHELVYFHKRDKKIIFYYSLLLLLKNTQKIEIAILYNNEKIDLQQIKHFLSQEDYGGSQEIVEQLQQRVIWLYSNNFTIYRFNLEFLGILQKERQFLKVIIISDVNAYEVVEKGSMEKFYKKIPTEMFVLSFKKDLYDYKLTQRNGMQNASSGVSASLLENIGSNHYDLNERAMNVLSKKYESLALKCCTSLIIPIECIAIENLKIQESYRTVLLRKDQRVGKVIEFIFASMPFKLLTIRQL